MAVYRLGDAHPQVAASAWVADSAQVIGDVALVRSTNKAIRRRDGNEVTGMTMYTDTYLFESGAWKCIQAQMDVRVPRYAYVHCHHSALTLCLCRNTSRNRSNLIILSRRSSSVQRLAELCSSGERNSGHLLRRMWA